MTEKTVLALRWALGDTDSFRLLFTVGVCFYFKEIEGQKISPRNTRLSEQVPEGADISCRTDEEGGYAIY